LAHASRRLLLKSWNIDLRPLEDKGRSDAEESTMEGLETKTTGTVESIVAKGAGPNSGEIAVSLKEPHQSFWVFMDTPRDKFFSILQTAFEAMWDSKTVEITSVLENGDQVIRSIRLT
jgi:hypothetical protein